MRNVFLLFASVIGLLSVSSCAKDHSNGLEIEKGVGSETKKEVIVNAYFYDAKGYGGITTRVIDKTWEKGDAIGLFMKNAGTVLASSSLANNVKLITEGSSKFTYLQDEKVYFPYNKEKVDFISYHPYSSSVVGLNYMIDVSDQTSLSAIDLLYSNNGKDKNYDSGEVELSFEHQLTKVVFTIAVNNSGKDLAGLTARITNVNTKATFSLIDGTIVEENTPNGVTLNVDNSSTVLQAILLPDEDLSNKILILTLGETNYTYPLISSTIDSFEKSKKCEYNISLEGANIKGLNATISDWTTVKDDIEVTEEPSKTTPEDGDGSGSSGGDATTTPPGEGEGSDNGATEEDVPIVGDGTEANPYNITQAIEIAKNQHKDQSETDVWIKGYIVGFYDNFNLSSFVKGVEQGVKLRLALAFTPKEEDFEKTFRVMLDITKIKDALSLAIDSVNIKKEISLKGNITFLNVYDDGNLHGMNALTRAIINGETYKK